MLRYHPALRVGRMTRALKRLTVGLALAAVFAAVAGATRAAAPAALPCIQPAQPAWIDYGDKWVPFRRTFFRPGMAVALAHDAAAADARRRGAQLAFWAMSLKRAVGTPAAPAAPTTIPTATARLARAAVRVTGCATPVIALNELFGAQRETPWTAANAQYRANVLALVQGLAARGAQPHLLISQAGSMRGAAASWWRELAASATIVREVYLPAPRLHRLGPGRASVYVRFQLRRAVRNFTSHGIPSNRVAIALGFQPGVGGRLGLAPLAWFGVVKRETLAVRQIAQELSLASIWSWGWATFPGGRSDPATRAAACVYLWVRAPSLCDGPAAAGPGFDRSLAQPAESSADRVAFRLLSPRHPVWLRVTAPAKLAARVAYVQVRRAGPWQNVRRVVFGLRQRAVRVPLGNGRWFVRLSVVGENAPQGEGFSTPAMSVRVR